MKGLGYLVSPADDRDYSILHDEVSPRLASLGQWSVREMLKRVWLKPTPDSVDLREHCSPIHNQGSLNSCTAHAGTNLLEFMQKKAHGKYTQMSRLFLYWATRKLLGWDEQDIGAYLRTTMAAMRVYGVPPEQFYPYNEAEVHTEPPAWLYPLADDYEALQYVRLDTGLLDRLVLQLRIESFLTNGIPVMFGFSVYSNLGDMGPDNVIPLPAGNVEGGHAIVAVGYRDDALLIQNSWGTGWGNNGYGWLPLDYIKRGLAQDFWALLKADWVDMEEFS